MLIGHYCSYFNIGLVSKCKLFLGFCVDWFIVFCIWQINAHKSPLAAMALSSDGSYLATASEQGTVIRVYLVSQPSEVNIVMIHNIFILFML